MRNVGPILMLLTVLGLFGGFAWLTQHPDTPWLEQAEDWPMLGDLARRFREAYLGTRVASGSTEATSEEPDDATAPERPTGRQEPESTRARRTQPAEPPARVEAPVRTTPVPPPRASGLTSEPLRLADVEAALAREIERRRNPIPEAMRPLHELPFKIDEWRWILPGNAIRTAASPEAEVLETFRSMTYLPLLGKREPWIQVLYRGQKGWIDTSWEPPFERRKASRGLLRHRYEPVKASDSLILKRARKMLGIDRPSQTLGAYTLFTDVEDEELLGFLDLAAGTAEEAYFARYGRLPSGNPKRSVVLFAKEADYRSFSADSRGLSGNQVGHAGRGVLAFFAERGTRQSLARTLVHEIGHLLNDRAVARSLPPWMEEGMASDLGSVWIEGTPSAKVDRSARGLLQLLIQGTDTRVMQLAATHAAGTLPSVGVLMSLDRTKFHSSPAYAYAHSASFVHFLLDAEAAGRGEAFRAFLKRIAAGHGADPRYLLKRLAMDLDELDSAFRDWLLAEAAASEKRLNG